MTLPDRYRIVRRLGTGSIGTALGIARPAVTLAIATLVASGCRTIDDPAAYRETPEYEVLLEAAAFEGTTIGAGGETPNAVFALQWMLAAPSADAAFKDLLERAGLPGKLYALCGLYWTDPSAFAAGVERLKPVKAPVEYLSFGCIGDEITAEELAAREIASGYWPRIFKEYRGKEPPPGELLLLTAALRSRDPEEVADAASSLAVFGSASKSALPAVKKLLHDPDEGVQGDAETTIEVIEGRDG